MAFHTNFRLLYSFPQQFYAVYSGYHQYLCSIYYVLANFVLPVALCITSFSLVTHLITLSSLPCSIIATALSHFLSLSLSIFVPFSHLFCEALLYPIEFQCAFCATTRHFLCHIICHCISGLPCVLLSCAILLGDP